MSYSHVRTHCCASIWNTQRIYVFTIW